MIKERKKERKKKGEGKRRERQKGSKERRKSELRKKGFVSLINGILTFMGYLKPSQEWYNLIYLWGRIRGN